MRLQALLLELLSRLSARQGATLYVGDEELDTWPTEIVAVLQGAEILVRASPVIRLVCPGCERMCSKPVQVRPALDDRPAETFIDCDEPEAMGRFSIDPRALERWEISAEVLARALTRILDFPSLPRRDSTGKRWTLGSLRGEHRRADVALVVDDGVALVIAGHTAPLQEIITVDQSRLAVDRAKLCALADRPPLDETPEQRRRRLRRRADELRAGGTKAFLEVLAREEKLSVSRIKQLIRPKRDPTLKALKRQP